jgi:CheY-like chemotaxis protein
MKNQKTDAPTASSSLQILVVEDESLVAMMIEDMLTDLGHQVVATSGRMPEASKLVSDPSADLAILDVNLNGEETYPLADSLAARKIPFIFATGYGFRNQGRMVGRAGSAEAVSVPRARQRDQPCNTKMTAAN